MKKLSLTFLFALLTTFMLSSCEQEIIEPDYITTDSANEIETNDNPGPSCSECPK